MMDSHPDHLGQHHGARPPSESGSRQLMMPPFQSLPPSQYATSDIPSTSKPSPAPLSTSSLFGANGASGNRRSVADGTGVPLQTPPIGMNGGSSPDSHAGSAGYTWGGHNDSWAGRLPQPQYGNRTPSALNASGFYFSNVNPMPSTTSNNISPITATTPADNLPSFHSPPATSMSHLALDQASSNGNSNGPLPPFRQSSTNYTPRPGPSPSRSSSFPTPACTMGSYVPGISSMLPITTMASSSRPGLAAPLSPLGSSGPPGAPPPPHGPGRLSPYSSGHAQHQYMHNLGNPGGPMALVSHYGGVPAGQAAFGSHFSGMMFPQQQRTPEKPHQCDQCPTAFTRNHDLKRHKRIHWAVKPYPCDGCDKAFSRKDALKRHKLVKCCGHDSKTKKEGSPSSSGTQGASGDMSPDDSKR